MMFALVFPLRKALRNGEKWGFWPFTHSLTKS